MVFLFLSILFLILRSYSFLSPGAVILGLSILFFRKKGISEEFESKNLPVSYLSLCLLVIAGLDGSSAGDILDLVCIHCSGILFLKQSVRPRDFLEKKTNFLAAEWLDDPGFLRQSRMLVLLLIAGFRIWYQTEFDFWNALHFLYLLKAGILSFLLGVVWLRNGESGARTLFLILLVLIILIVHPSQGILNFSYFHLFSFLQTHPESKKINVGLEL
ncbi:hypothetical protein AB3N59_10635 [Leptospira sp. WS92.C1]